MGIRDIISNLKEYGFNQPVTSFHPELQALLDEGMFVVDLADILDEDLSSGGSAAQGEPAPDGFEGHDFVRVGFWDYNTMQGCADYYDKFSQLFYDYLGWDCSQRRDAKVAGEFMEQCVVPILSDYYQQTGYGRMDLVRNRRESSSSGGLFFVWSYPSL